jgi:hypothetical protein
MLCYVSTSLERIEEAEMRFASGIVLLSAVALAAPASAQSFLGKWLATGMSPGGSISETVTAVKTDDGYAVTAALIDPAPGGLEAGPGTDVKLEGDGFFYKRKVSLPSGAQIEITYSGTVSGDTFTGTAQIDGGGDAIPYSGVRFSDPD